MKPEITCNVNAELKFFGDLTVNAGYNFTQFTKSEEGKRVNFKNDVNLRLSYRITPRLGVYIQGHNLLNDNYYEYAGYETLGARGLLGVTANF
jgi:outer membrane cobalamin receptor